MWFGTLSLASPPLPLLTQKRTFCPPPYDDFFHLGRSPLFSLTAFFPHGLRGHRILLIHFFLISLHNFHPPPFRYSRPSFTSTHTLTHLPTSIHNDPSPLLSSRDNSRWIAKWNPSRLPTFEPLPSFKFHPSDSVHDLGLVPPPPPSSFCTFWRIPPLNSQLGCVLPMALLLSRLSGSHSRCVFENPFPPGLYHGGSTLRPLLH